MSDFLPGYDVNWKMSPSIGKLVESLAKAQLKYDPALKDTKNPAYNSLYADLASIISATQPHLAANGLVVVQMPHANFNNGDAKMMTLTTLLAHSSGEWITSDLTLPAMMRERFDAQSVGSAITYAKRYAYSAIVGVAPEVDDDGNKAAGVGSKEAAQSVAVAKLKKHAGADESVELVPWKLDLLAIRGNGLAIVRAEMKADEKAQFTFKLDNELRGYTIPLSQGNMFASICEKYKVECKWADLVEPGERG